MKVYHGVRDLKAPLAGSVVTIGNFDGVHLGHRQLIEEVLVQTRLAGLSSVVMTFWPHPRQILQPQIKMRRLFSTDDLAEQLASLGVDILVVEPFSRELSETPPNLFIDQYVVRPLGLRHLVVGYDFSFGANREGNLDLLKRLSGAEQWGLSVVPALRMKDVVVSSSRIRSCLEQGDMVQAHQFLGRPFYVSGVVERGAGRGRQLGLPTANLVEGAEAVPRQGVYVTQVQIGNELFRSVTNVGTAPTVSASNRVLKIETHILDFSRDLYGTRIRVHFLDWLREERQFSDLNELTQQIRKDCEQARNWKIGSR